VVEPVTSASCALPTSRADNRSDCRTLVTAAIDVDHDGQDDCAGWIRCGPDVPSPTSDGGLVYPRDGVTVALFGGKSLSLYDNRDVAVAERFEALSVVRAGAERRLLMRAVGYGTGNVQNWSLVDVVGERTREFREPALEAVTASLLGPGEHLGKSLGTGVEVRDGGIEVARLVYRTGDPNCCPTGGVMRIRLALEEGGLVADKAWREPPPTTP
jgi:hypothetical protein